MSEAIVWGMDLTDPSPYYMRKVATIDGVRVVAELSMTIWGCSAGDVTILYANDTDRERNLAARAVVAAVKVLRGEADAALAAEWGRCESLKIALREIARPKRGWVEVSSTDAECAEYWSAACEWERKTAREALSAIESGAPAPRDG